MISCRPAASSLPAGCLAGTLQNHGFEFRKCGGELAEVKKGEGVESDLSAMCAFASRFFLAGLHLMADTQSDIYRIGVISCRPAASNLPAGCLAGTLQNYGVEFRKRGDELAEFKRREAVGWSVSLVCID